MREQPRMAGLTLTVECKPHATLHPLHSLLRRHASTTTTSAAAAHDTAAAADLQ